VMTTSISGLVGCSRWSIDGQSVKTNEVGVLHVVQPVEAPKRTVQCCFI